MKRSPSLRTRVALVSGVVAALVALTLTITFAALLNATGERQLDETVSSMAVRVAPPLKGVPAETVPPPPAPPPPAAPAPGQAPAPDRASAPTRETEAPAPTRPPDAPGYMTDIPEESALAPGMPSDVAVTRVDGLPGVLVALDPNRDVVASAIHRSQLIGLGIGVAGALIAAVLGWFLAGYAARPLRRLAAATHGIDTLEELPPLSGRGAREAEELSDAITRMLARLEAAHRATNHALTSARDFAAVCAHELRTPLTALRTDLQVLATKEIPAEQRGAILTEVLFAEQQIENTLTDLERLAVGELTEPDAFEPFDLCETLDRAVQDAQRRHPDVRIDLAECDPITVTGLPGGLMLIVTNAVANAVEHGHADTVTVTVHPAADHTIEILIDDNGRGVPDTVRPNAFDRFSKGPGSPGSGLGLALVRQQAELHSGTAELDHSPLGGTRLRVRITAST
ncbi:sensor histidine kinase [Nocardia iowensis]|uniref:histidine kinase n=1 Tax=Nocardia iowensis TaxID=204891 RepID=A0ABX8RUQ6_NOCIO|nr:HAMP domain-containing sensor histidine kinase [Nocardia iowensis]QXN93369.1 HAMP domain-containing histidine kinase [Nocardia iowensis]